MVCLPSILSSAGCPQLAYCCQQHSCKPAAHACRPPDIRIVNTYLQHHCVHRASFAMLLLQVAKRKAEEAAAGQPAAKAGPGGVRKKIIDEDVTAGDDRTGGTGLDVMGVDDLQAELAVNEAAKGAVVVEAGNVQVGVVGICGSRQMRLAASACRPTAHP